MDRQKIALIIGWIIVLSALTVVGGLLGQVEWIMYPFSRWISMRLVSAICFLFSGVHLVIYVLAKSGKISAAFSNSISPSFALVVLLLLSGAFLPQLFGFSGGIGSNLVLDVRKEIYSIEPGLPSLATLVNFMMIAIFALIIPVQTNYSKRVSCIIGWAVLLIGAVAIIGYITNIPGLFYYFVGKSSAMSPISAILFVLWGSAVLFQCSKKA
jgi:hypothetical protein